jgi:hypothetical protein
LPPERFAADHRACLGCWPDAYGVAARGELEIAGKRRIFQTLDAVFYRRWIGKQHMQAGAIGDDIQIYVITLGAVIFDHVRGVIQHEVHDRWIILIDLNN